MIEPLDMRMTGQFHVQFAEKPRHYKAQYFWPDVKPWPLHVCQTSSEGELYDTYYAFVHFQTVPIHPGCLVLMDELENIQIIVYPQQLREETYLITPCEAPVRRA